MYGGKSEALRRLSQKHLEDQFLWELEKNYELSPKLSELLLESAKTILLQRAEISYGKRLLIGVSIDEPSGKCMRELQKVKVIVDWDLGLEDIELERDYGGDWLRCMRILRVIESGIEQGGLFSQEDLGRIFGVSTRTIKRDVKYLRELGYEVLTRGYYKGIGRGQSHKSRIVEMYLEGRHYEDIKNAMRHSLISIKRYVETFSRVVLAYRRGFKDVRSLSMVVGITEKLAEEYLGLYHKHKESKHEFIEELLSRFSMPNKLEYKELDRRKVGFKKSVVGKEVVVC